MGARIVLYGAGGFSGRLVARLAQARWKTPSDPELVLAGRRADALAPLADELGLPVRVFATDDPRGAARVLGEPGVRAVINAAGPFDRTALALARAAIGAGVHYLDLNGEADVYRRLDDLAYAAWERGVALVTAAGHCATTSDVMLDQALAVLTATGKPAALGSIRVANARWRHLSRGSAQTALRVWREQVVHLQAGKAGSGGLDAVLDEVHEPLGRVERSFDFGDAPARPRKALAAAVSLAEVFTARATVQRHRQRLAGSSAPVSLPVHKIEGYVEIPEGLRGLVHAGALGGVMQALPGVRRTLGMAFDNWPEGPNAHELDEDAHVVALQIDSASGETLIDWRAKTPSPYRFSAWCVLQAVQGLLADTSLRGWQTPAAVVGARGRLSVPAQAARPPVLDAGPFWTGCTVWSQR